MKIAIGNDHVAVNLKFAIMEYLTEKGYEVINVGTDTKDEYYYPISGYRVGKLVSEKKADCGIVMCGTGVGIAVAANKVSGIRAAVCSEVFTAKMSKVATNCNVLAFGERVVTVDTAKELVDAFLSAEYRGGATKIRLDMITELEETGTINFTD